jgi:hypothetical protein
MQAPISKKRGTDWTPAACPPATAAGVVMSGNNLIGGTTPGGRNVISGNRDGVRLTGTESAVQ